MEEKTLLDVKQLKLYFKTTKGVVQAVDKVDFKLSTNQACVIVGESGCGKSSMAKAILRLLPRNVAEYSGEVFLNGKDIMKLNDEEYRKQVRWVKMSMVPQAAMNALNPVLRVGDQVSEPLIVHFGIKKEEALSGYEEDKKQFILAKKAVAIGLLVFFHIILIKHFYMYITGGHDIDPFEALYTLLIISDVLILFISMRYGHDYRIAFRNSGFAVVTVFIRVSLIATPYYSAMIGAGAAVFALGTLYVYSYSIRIDGEMRNQKNDSV